MRLRALALRHRLVGIFVFQLVERQGLRRRTAAGRFPQRPCRSW
jgi:hypothetical protein